MYDQSLSREKENGSNVKTPRGYVTRLNIHIERLSRESNGIPLQYSCLENPMDGEPDGLQSMGSRRVGHD